MDFKKLSEVTQVTEAADTANVLIEEDGVVKRVPKSEVGTDIYTMSVDADETIVTINDINFNIEDTSDGHITISDTDWDTIADLIPDMSMIKYVNYYKQLYGIGLCHKVSDSELGTNYYAISFGETYKTIGQKSYPE